MQTTSHSEPESWENVEAKRLVKRLHRHRQELLVFLYREGVPSVNNHAERMIRNGVVMRKNSYCNRSEEGAETQAVLMSVFRTLKQCGFQGTDSVVDALRQYFATKKLPKLPKTTQRNSPQIKPACSCEIARKQRSRQLKMPK